MKHALRLFLLIMVLIGAAVASPAAADNNEVWLSYGDALEKAENEEKPVMLFVEAEWCVHCQRMKEESFSREDIRQKLTENFYPVLIDLDSREKLQFRGEEITERELARSLGVQTTPTTFFLDAEEEVLGSREAFMETEVICDLLAFVNSENFGEVSFEEFRNQRE